MGFLRRRSLFVPVVAFLAAVLVLGLALLFFTGRNIRQTRRRLAEQLYQKGLTLIRTVEAGARSGMMSFGYGQEFTSRLLQEASKEPDVLFIMLVAADGRPVAASSTEPAPTLPPLPRGIGDGLPRRVLLPGDGRPTMLLFKKFTPPASGGMMRGRMMGRQFPELPREDLFVVLSLDMRPVADAQRQALRSAWLTGLILLLAGAGGILLFGVTQNYYLLRSTLASTRSYADRVVESMADGLVAVDAGGIVTVTNPEISRILPGLAPSSSGRRLAELFPEIADDLRRALEGGKTVLDRPLATSRDDLPLRLEYSVTPLKGEEGISGAVVLVRDVGEVQDLRRRLQEGEKLAALGGMAAAVAHEVRNPLSSIKGLSQLLASKLPEGSQERRHTSVIVDEVNRLDRFVEELLVFVRPSRPSLVLSDLAAAVEDTVALVRDEATGKGISIETSKTAGVPPVMLDPDLFRRALLNILINSMEATDEAGGRITVSVEPSPEGGARLTVADTGKGLPREAGERIFESFFSTKPGGTGLGLSIIRQVTDGHGWSYRLADAPGGGTVTAITLPGAPRQEPSNG